MLTTVMGMLGALGKTNLMSSNFPRRRHVSASDTLPPSVRCSDGPATVTSLEAAHHPAPLLYLCQPSFHKLSSGRPPVSQPVCHDHRRSVLLQSRDDQRLFSGHLKTMCHNFAESKDKNRKE